MVPKVNQLHIHLNGIDHQVNWSENKRDLTMFITNAAPLEDLLAIEVLRQLREKGQLKNNYKLSQGEVQNSAPFTGDALIVFKAMN